MALGCGVNKAADKRKKANCFWMNMLLTPQPRYVSTAPPSSTASHWG